MKRAFLRIVCLGAMLSLLVGCAGYRLGNQVLYPAHIRTVYVPIVESTSFRRNQGEWLTEAVCKQIEAVTPYKVVDSDGADSTLIIRIVEEGKRLLIQSRSGDPLEVQTRLRVEVSWLDHQGALMRQCDTIPVPPEITDVMTTGNVIPETGQSVTTAYERAIERMATEIVGLMEAPW